MGKKCLLRYFDKFVRLHGPKLIWDFFTRSDEDQARDQKTMQGRRNLQHWWEPSLIPQSFDWKVSPLSKGANYAHHLTPGFPDLPTALPWVWVAGTEPESGRQGRAGTSHHKKSWAGKFLLVTISSAKCTWPFCTDRTSQKMCTKSWSWRLLLGSGKLHLSL